MHKLRVDFLKMPPLNIREWGYPPVLTIYKLKIKIMAAINVAKRTARVSKDTPTEVLNKLTSSELDPMLDKTIGQCIEEGLITDMCNSKGEFAFKHANYDNVYALINGGLVDVSAA